jgi:hypothetical protein
MNTYEHPVQLNYQGDLKNDFFGLPLAKAEELVMTWTEISWNAIENYSEYRVAGTGENKGLYRLDQGKLLKQFMDHTHNVAEWAFCLFSAPKIFDAIEERYEDRTNPLVALLIDLMKG